MKKQSDLIVLTLELKELKYISVPQGMMLRSYYQREISIKSGVSLHIGSYTIKLNVVTRQHNNPNFKIGMAGHKIQHFWSVYLHLFVFTIVIIMIEKYVC